MDLIELTLGHLRYFFRGIEDQERRYGIEDLDPSWSIKSNFTDPYVIYLKEAEQKSHKAWFSIFALNVEQEKEVATEK